MYDHTCGFTVPHGGSLNVSSPHVREYEREVTTCAYEPMSSCAHET